MNVFNMTYREKDEIKQKLKKRSHIYTILISMLLIALLVLVVFRKHNGKTNPVEGTSANVSINIADNETITAN